MPNLSATLERDPTNTVHPPRAGASDYFGQIVVFLAAVFLVIGYHTAIGFFRFARRLAS